MFCLLVSALGFGPLINWVRFLDIRHTPSTVGCISSLIIRPHLPQTVCCLNDDVWLYISRLVRWGRVPEENYSVWHCLTHQLNIHFCDLWWAKYISGIHLTLVAVVANFTFPEIELPLTRGGLSVGVLLSGDYVFDTWTDSQGCASCYGQSPSRPGFPAARELLGD